MSKVTNALIQKLVLILLTKTRQRRNKIVKTPFYQSSSLKGKTSFIKVRT